MKALSPNCLQIRCICHSLALCIQHAANKLPSNIGFLLSEIPNWFSNSEIRREAYMQLFKVMNATEFSCDERTAPLPFEKMFTTRWLVRGTVMFNILTNWHELQPYFTAAEISQGRLDNLSGHSSE